MVSTINTQQSTLKKTSAQIDPLGLAPIPEDLRQRFLKFKLLGEYRTLLPLKNIVEVHQLSTLDILPVPEASNSMLGVCNWRGDILWLTDLNALVGNTPLWHQSPLLMQSVAIVVQSAQKKLGLVVERVDDIEQIEPRSIHQNTDLCSPIWAPYVAGYIADYPGLVLDVAAIVANCFQD
ncbi:MAG: CheW domain-containing protein [Cyanobacteria bacterium P01_B01_bin.77]